MQQPLHADPHQLLCHYWCLKHVWQNMWPANIRTLVNSLICLTKLLITDMTVRGFPKLFSQRSTQNSSPCPAQRHGRLPRIPLGQLPCHKRNLQGLCTSNERWQVLSISQCLNLWWPPCLHDRPMMTKNYSRKSNRSSLEWVIQIALTCIDYVA